MTSSPTPARAVTADLLARVRAGDQTALDQLFPLVHGQLRVQARRLLARERPGHTLQPTDLVHEAYLKLAGSPGGPAAEDRAHFCGIAARAMRQILVDHARGRNAVKRGGGVDPVRLSDARLGIEVTFDELIGLDDALDRLAEVSDRLRQVVEYRFFGGLTEDEVAAVLGVTVRTVQRDWVKARAWLYKEMYPRGEDPS